MQHRRELPYLPQLHLLDVEGHLRWKYWIWDAVRNLSSRHVSNPDLHSCCRPRDLYQGCLQYFMYLLHSLIFDPQEEHKPTISKWKCAADWNNLVPGPNQTCSEPAALSHVRAVSAHSKEKMVAETQNKPNNIVHGLLSSGRGCLIRFRVPT